MSCGALGCVEDNVGSHIDWTGLSLNLAFLAKLGTCSGAGGSCWGAVGRWLLHKFVLWLVSEGDLLGDSCAVFGNSLGFFGPGGGSVLTCGVRLLHPVCILLILIIIYYKMAPLSS